MALQRVLKSQIQPPIKNTNDAITTKHPWLNLWSKQQTKWLWLDLKLTKELSTIGRLIVRFFPFLFHYWLF